MLSCQSRDARRTMADDAEFIIGRAYARPVGQSALQLRYSIANALETIATGLLSVADSSVTRPKLMVRPRRTTRASASTSEAETARMKCVVWSTVVIGR